MKTQRGKFAHLFDDAALFPPAQLPLPDAVREHREHQRAWYAGLIGPFVVGELPLRQLTRVLATDAEPLPVSLVVSSGPTGVGSAVVRSAADSRLRLVAVDVAPMPGRTVLAATCALAQHLPDGATGYIEIPWNISDSALDALVGTGFRAKLRTGGVTAGSFPDKIELAARLLACVERRIPFKCTAGLHRAVRHTAPDTKFEHHGFLNVFLATHAAQSGRPVGEIAAILDERNATAVAAAISALDDAAVETLRHGFVSLGTCSIAEPVGDLVALGLVHRTAHVRHGVGA